MTDLPNDAIFITGDVDDHTLDFRAKLIELGVSTTYADQASVERRARLYRIEHVTDGNSILTGRL